MNGLELNGALWANQVPDLGLKILDGGAHEIAFAPRATIYEFLSPERLDAFEELVYCFTHTLTRNRRCHVECRQEWVVRSQDTVEDLVTIGAAESDAVLGGIGRGTPFVQSAPLMSRDIGPWMAFCTWTGRASNQNP